MTPSGDWSDAECPGGAGQDGLPGLDERPGGPPRIAPPGHAEKTPRHHDGHRDRLRERFSTAGEEALADDELLDAKERIIDWSKTKKNGMPHAIPVPTIAAELIESITRGHLDPLRRRFLLAS